MRVPKQLALVGVASRRETGDEGVEPRLGGGQDKAGEEQEEGEEELHRVELSAELHCPKECDF